MIEWNDIDFSTLETPCYVVDLGRLRGNLELLARVQERAGCKILLALKGFAMWGVFPLVRQYLAGVAASSPSEARLGREEFCAGEAGHHEVHAYAPAYSEADIAELVKYADHIVFNSTSQWQRLGPLVGAAERRIECGVRINPEHSEVKTPIYDPCSPGSRLGITPAEFDLDALAGVDGIHFHTLCELGSDALERTIAAVEDKFSFVLDRVSWVNFGGGHHITRPDYDVDRLIRIVGEFRSRHDVDVYLEPGEAIALNTGVLVTSVLDMVHNRMDIAILDTSATAHMPDVLEMPYRPDILGGGEPGQNAHTYRLGGLTCLAGDVIGDYSFARPLSIGQKLVFLDMAHYTMVKNTMFNGVRLPSIAVYDETSTETGGFTDHFKVLRRFGYQDYKSRLG